MVEVLKWRELKMILYHGGKSARWKFWWKNLDERALWFQVFTYKILFKFFKEECFIFIVKISCFFFFYFVEGFSLVIPECLFILKVRLLSSRTCQPVSFVAGRLGQSWIPWRDRWAPVNVSFCRSLALSWSVFSSLLSGNIGWL